jgi:hypothetical protein
MILLSREQSFVNQLSPQCDTNRVIHIENLNRDAANCRSTFERRTIPSEVVVPFMATRIEQSYELGTRCLRVDARQVRTFVTVAMQTGVGEIAEHRRSAMLFGDNVFNFIDAGMEPIRKLAIIAKVPRTMANPSDK